MYMAKLRINSFVAKALGISRRKADRLLKCRQADFLINDKPFDGNLGLKIDPDVDKISFKGSDLFLPLPKYVLLNKPPGFVTSTFDPYAKNIVMDLLPKKLRSLKPIGRLDKDTRGLLLLTDDGRLIHRLLHPKYRVEKEYVVKIKGAILDEAFMQICKGIDLGDVKTLPCKGKIIKVGMYSSVVILTMIEGKRRQIRRMFDLIGYPVIDLLRVRFGPIKLGNIKEGKWRFLLEEEVNQLKKAAGLCSDI